MGIEGIVLEHHADTAVLGRKSETSSSPKRSCPSVGLSKPQIRFRAVLLPQPEGPKSPISLPSGDLEVEVIYGNDIFAVFPAADRTAGGNFLVRCCNTIFMCIFPFLINESKSHRSPSNHWIYDPGRGIRSFGDAEYPQAFYKVLFPPGGNNDLIQHIFIADIFQTFQRVMYGEVEYWGVMRRLFSVEPGPGSCFSIPDCGGCV